MNQSDKKHLKAIIFDMDGTIIDSNQIWDRAVQSALAFHGVTTINAGQALQLKALSGVHILESVRILKKIFNLSISHKELAKTIVIKAKDSLVDGVSFIKGFPEFHSHIQTLNIPSSIATNADDESLQALIRSMKLDSFFGGNIFNASHVGNKSKPDPAMFLHAAEQLGAHPSECVVFEDSPIGFAAAKAAGITCIAVKNEHNKHILDRVASSIEHYHEAHEKLSDLFHIKILGQENKK